MDRVDEACERVAKAWDNHGKSDYFREVYEAVGAELGSPSDDAMTIAVGEAVIPLLSRIAELEAALKNLLDANRLEGTAQNLTSERWDEVVTAALAALGEK